MVNHFKNKYFLIIIFLVIILMIIWAIYFRLFYNTTEESLVIKNYPKNHLERQIVEGSSTTPALKTYRNEEYGFEFQYPEGWIFHENTFYTPFSKFNLVGSPSGENFLPNFPFLINIADPEYIDRRFSDLKNTYSKTTIAKVEGLRYEYKEQKLSYLTIVLPFEQYKIILSATKAYEDVFNQIIASFKFLK